MSDNSINNNNKNVKSRQQAFFMFSGSGLPAPGSDHLVAVGRLACFNDPKSYAGRSVKTPGRVTHARQVEG